MNSFEIFMESYLSDTKKLPYPNFPREQMQTDVMQLLSETERFDPVYQYIIGNTFSKKVVKQVFVFNQETTTHSLIPYEDGLEEKPNLIIVANLFVIGIFTDKSFIEGLRLYSCCLRQLTDR